MRCNRISSNPSLTSEVPVPITKELTKIEIKERFCRNSPTKRIVKFLQKNRTISYTIYPKGGVFLDHRKEMLCQGVVFTVRCICIT